jgi:hypothetical protein
MLDEPARLLRALRALVLAESHRQAQRFSIH